MMGMVYWAVLVAVGFGVAFVAEPKSRAERKGLIWGAMFTAQGVLAGLTKLIEAVEA